jgi:hypothetical protein
MADGGRRGGGHGAPLMTARPLRAVAHLHSNWSYDGSLALEEIARILARLGYRAALMSEHDRGFDEERWRRYQRACAAATTSDIVLVPGLEYSDAGNDVHVLVWGAGPFLGAGRQTSALLDDVQAAGAVAVLAHPGRRAAGERLRSQDLARLHGVEVWNRKYDGIAPGQAALRLRMDNPHLQPFVGLDLHTRRQLFPLSMLLDVERGAGPAAMVSALRRPGAVPHAVGIPADTFSSPMGQTAFGCAERTRRATLRRVRALRS